MSKNIDKEVEMTDYTSYGVNPGRNHALSYL